MGQADKSPKQKAPASRYLSLLNEWIIIDPARFAIIK